MWEWASLEMLHMCVLLSPYCVMPVAVSYVNLKKLFSRHGGDRDQVYVINYTFHIIRSLANKMKRCKYFKGQSERRGSEVIKMWRNIVTQTRLHLNILYYPHIFTRHKPTETKTYDERTGERMPTSVWDDGRWMGDWS